MMMMVMVMGVAMAMGMPTGGWLIASAMAIVTAVILSLQHTGHRPAAHACHPRRLDHP
jgi:hypothetical protein